MAAVCAAVAAKPVTTLADASIQAARTEAMIFFDVLIDTLSF